MWTTRTSSAIDHEDVRSATQSTPVRKDIHTRLILRMRVTDKMDNTLGNMHGGCSATLVDNITSMVIWYHTSGVHGQPWSFLGVSQNISVLYLKLVRSDL